MEEKIIEIANVLLKKNFMYHTDQEPITTLTDALVMIVFEAGADQNFELEIEEVYNHINKHIVSNGEAENEEEKPNEEVSLFKELTEEEKTDFRKWARENYIHYSLISEMWHPVTREECEKMNEEADERSEEAYQRKYRK